jgi:hypothetical protein
MWHSKFAKTSSWTKRVSGCGRQTVTGGRVLDLGAGSGIVGRRDLDTVQCGVEAERGAVCAIASASLHGDGRPGMAVSDCVADHGPAGKVG